jgi:cell division control protein 6
MITNARVLQSEWVPREIVHRNTEKNGMRNALKPAVEGDLPQDLFLTGPSGAGKTCLARYTLAKLEEESLDITTQYVDCWTHGKRFRVLLDLLDAVGPTHDIHRSTPHDEMLARLEDLDHPYVVILDEVDQLQDKDLLRELYSIPEITMVLIANQASDVLDTLDERLRSRLRSSVRVPFERYGDDELVEILRARANAGLEPASVTETQLELIADAAAGNARDAISILRTAARHAEHDEADRITSEQLEAAIPEARSRQRQQSLDKLSEHQRIIWDLLLEAGELSPREAYQHYCSRVDDPKTNRTVRKYLRKLERYGLVEGSGRGPSRVYRGLGVASR